MKKLKKAFAVLLSVAMILGMSSTVFAAGEGTGQTPKPTDREYAKVQNVESKATVTAYQIVEATYGENGRGFTGYQDVKGVTLADQQTHKPTATEVNQIAQKLVKSELNLKSTPMTIPAGGSEHQAKLAPGYWIVLVTGEKLEKVYNPMLIGVYYSVNGQGLEDSLRYGIVDASTNWDLESSDAYAKSSDTGITKDVEGISENDEGKVSASLGQAVKYTLTPTIPNYPSNATNRTVVVSDRPSAGLTLIYNTLTIHLTDKNGAEQSITINNNQFGELATAAEFAFEKEGKACKGFNILFDYEKLLEYTGLTNSTAQNMDLTVTYNAIINENAVVGGTGNDNTAHLYYANDPNSEPGYTQPSQDPDQASDLEDKTDNEVVYTYQLAFKKTDEKGNVDGALAGAIFGIYTEQACENQIDTVEVNENGYAVSMNVASGVYWVKEIKAPEGYSLNDKPYQVTATWKSAQQTIKNSQKETKYTTTKTEAYDYDAEENPNPESVGWIKNSIFYPALPQGVTAATAENEGYRPAYIKSISTTTATESDIVTNAEGNGTVLIGEPIPNTKLGELPSTGGIGTIIFTVGGCLIMVVAAALYFANRRRSANSESK